ncbi:hypothetical protein CSUI_005613 [Cystoisospora suis]|uniref:Uncharacterized protein n=1 Tax=Cystoisospora suis TaxID=483139 RepID=A0A2C6KXB8_9APIC|nr:hypothetical protein CSUI_005613 [Cystoisospora suis]
MSCRFAGATAAGDGPSFNCRGRPRRPRGDSYVQRVSCAT